MNTIAAHLDIINIEIISITKLENGSIVIHVKSTENGTCCKHCGKHITKYHGLNKTIIINHLSIFGKPTYIQFQPVRFQCLECSGRPTTTQQVSWYKSACQCTEEYALYIIKQLINSTIQDVARQEGISYKKVVSIVNKYIPDKIDWSKVKIIKDIGIDEISLKKGHKDFVVIISTRIDGKIVVLGVLKNRKKETVKDFLLTIPSHLAKKIENVCSDMYDGFINAAKEVFGEKVNIVIDRFHVAKNYRNATDKLRKKEMKRLKSELSDEEYEKLKNIMWILRKNPNTLSDDEQKTLNLLFSHSSSVKTAYTLQNKLTNIFNKSLSKKQATHKINNWIKRVEKSGLTCFNTFINTFNKLSNEILNYFINRCNSGFVEGLNNKIKVIKRRCYGIFNTENLFQRISIDLAGYNLTL